MNIAQIKFLLGADPKYIAERVLFTPFLPLQLFKKEFTDIEKMFSGKSEYKGFTGMLNGERITVIRTGMGTANIGDILMWLGGHIKKAVFAGAVGALDQSYQIGDYFIPIEAIEGEGFSRYTRDNPEKIFMGSKHVQLDPNIIEKCQRYSVAKGKLFTIGGIVFEEDKMFLEFLKNQGVDAIDLETSAFYTAAQKGNIEALAFHYVSDLPPHKLFYEKYSKEDQLKLNYALEGFPKTVLDVLCAL